MNVELTRELCADVADALGLPHPGLVEKDFHVVRALVALQGIEAEGARLVFGGGTSLCRAYGLIERMPEASTSVDLATVKPMLRAIMEIDRGERGQRLPAYADDPQRVSREAIEVLSKDTDYAAAFVAFQRGMAYGEHVSMADCLPVLRQYAALM